MQQQKKVGSLCDQVRFLLKISIILKQGFLHTYKDFLSQFLKKITEKKNILSYLGDKSAYIMISIFNIQ